VGKCGHADVCLACALRMRLLVKDSTCAMCKAEWEEVVLLDAAADPRAAWAERASMVQDAELGVLYAGGRPMRAAVQELVAACKCPECGKEFESKQALAGHTGARHAKFFCEVCLEHLPAFTSEQTLYSKRDLARHIKEGMPGDAFRGHPLCKFCSTRFYDDKGLWEHMKRSHYRCELCLSADTLRFEHVYYADVDELERHGRKEHFLCDHPDCSRSLTNFYPTAIDLRAHEATAHAGSERNRQRAKNRGVQIDLGGLRSGGRMVHSSSTGSLGGGDAGGRGARETGGGRSGGRGGSAGRESHNAAGHADSLGRREAEMLGQRISGMGMGGGTNQQDRNGGPSIPPGFGGRPLAGVQAPAPPPDLASGPRPGEAAAAGMASRQQQQQAQQREQQRQREQLQQRQREQQQREQQQREQQHGAGPGESDADARTERNRRLMARIRDSVGDDGLAAFRQLSARFRAADVSAGDYVALMAAQFGEEVTVGILPDLLALLPDEARRRELSGAAMRFRQGLPARPRDGASAHRSAAPPPPPGRHHAGQGRPGGLAPPPGVDPGQGPRPSSGGPVLRGTWARGAGRGGSGSAAAALARMDTSARPRGWGR